MRTLVFLFVLGLCAFGVIYWLTMKASEDDTYSFGLAFGNTTADSIEIHVVVYNRTVRIDEPRFDPKSGVLLWREWIETHFELRDSKGATVHLEKVGGTALITGPDLGAGTPEFYLVGKLHKNEAYDFDYLPVPASGSRYRHSFTSPVDVEKLKRPLFRHVDVPAGSGARH